MKYDLTDKRVQSFYNNIAYHLSKEVIGRHIDTRKPALSELLNEIIMELDEVFPSEDNGWNYCFEENMSKLGFIRKEDVENAKLKRLEEYYKNLANDSRKDAKKISEK